MNHGLTNRRKARAIAIRATVEDARRAIAMRIVMATAAAVAVVQGVVLVHGLWSAAGR